MKIIIHKGGPSSGNWGHDGRVGKVGGSQPGGGYARVGVDRNHDKDMLRKYLTSNAGMLSKQRRRAESEARQLAKDLRFDPKRVHFQYSPYNFVIDGEQMTAAGLYNPATGDITVYPDAYSNKPYMYTGIKAGVLSHEIMHDRWNTFKKIAEEQTAEFISNNKAAFLSDKDKSEKYGAALLYKSILDNMHLPRLGGVSDYSNHYWAEWDKDPSTSNFIKAVNETLAECARLWHDTARPDLYKAVPHEWQSIFANVREYARKASSYD